MEAQGRRARVLGDFKTPAFMSYIGYFLLYIFYIYLYYFSNLERYNLKKIAIVLYYFKHFNHNGGGGPHSESAGD